MKKFKLLFPVLILPLVLSSCSFGTVRVDGKIDSRQINENMGMIDLPHQGQPKMLVIPVDFSDYPATALSGGSDQARTAIDKLFFGSTEETGWESVRTFYQKSSYGQLNIEGTVTPWYRASNTAVYYSALSYRSSSKDITDKLAVEAVNWVQANCPEIDLSEYDTDGDGNIDSVWLVYSRGYDTRTDLWWAYTTWNANENQDNLDTFVAAYSWASYDFIFKESGYRLPDAHTFIHETGHLLGLDDYYDTSVSPKMPTGGLAMMDCNIGDHDAFSKYLLDWITPNVVRASGSYTLRPFESSGDTLLIPISYSDNPYGEYLLLEYYTPTGLNAKDASEQYRPNKLQMFTESGILVYHVDNRLGKFTYAPSTGLSWNGKYYTDISSYRSNLYVYIPLNSNSPKLSYAADTNQKLVGLIGATDNSFRAAENRNKTVFNEALFQLGDSFNAASFLTNSNEKIPYSFEITTLEESEVTVVISENN